MIAQAPILSMVRRSSRPPLLLLDRALAHHRGSGEAHAHAHRGDHPRRAPAELDDGEHREGCVARGTTPARRLLRAPPSRSSRSRSMRRLKVSRAMASMPKVCMSLRSRSYGRQVTELQLVAARSAPRGRRTHAPRRGPSAARQTTRTSDPLLAAVVPASSVSTSHPTGRCPATGTASTRSDPGRGRRLVRRDADEIAATGVLAR